MKKLLVMGSNFGSIEIVREAKARGYHTIVTDYYDAEHSGAKRECDECWDISTNAIEMLAEKCRKEHVDAVACGVSEFNSEMTFKLCDAVGLSKYCTWEGWNFTRNKRRFKDMCKKHGVNVAKDYDISTLDTDNVIRDVSFPVVVKPIDRAANEGVTFCTDYKELRPAYDYAKSVTEHPDNIICEQMLIGKEYAAAFALCEGEASFLNLFEMHNEEGTPSNIYCLDVTKTGIIDKYLNQIDKGIKEVFREGGYTNGIAWIEMMHDSRDDKLYVLEAGYRFPAGLTPYTYKKISKFDALGWYLDGFMGIKHKKEDLPEQPTEEYEKYGATYLLWNSCGGRLTDIKGLDIVSEDSRIDIVDCLRWPGYELKPNTLMAEIIFTADTKEELIDVIKFINNTVKFVVEGGKDVLIRFTGFNKLR